ncbi:MAG: hypothetical protein ACLPVO_07895 [Desulfomonilaceae bacterium]
MKDKKLPKLVYKTKRTVSRSLDVFSDILTPTKDNLGIIPKSGVVVSVMKALRHINIF